MRDRRRYLHWLFEAKKRFGLCVLNYVITSNHVHLLTKDTGPNIIADSRTRGNGVASCITTMCDCKTCPRFSLSEWLIGKAPVEFPGRGSQ